MWFNIVLNNHGGMDVATAMRPLIDYMRTTFDACGHQSTITYDQIYLDAVNLYFEYFPYPAFNQNLLALKRTHDFRLGIIATELVVDDHIPYAAHGLIGSEAAENLAHNNARVEGLFAVTREADFVWSLLERTAQTLAPHANQSHYFPVGATASNCKAGHHAPKDIDILFFGSLTAHRAAVIDRLTAQGLNVTAIGRGFAIGWLPDAILQSYMDRAKIGLNLTLHAADSGQGNVDPRFASCIRIKEFLDRDIAIVSEDIPLDNPYAAYIRSGALDQLAGQCLALLRDQSWAEFGRRAGDSFRQAMRVEQLCGPIIDQTLANIRPRAKA
jgi:hypothetical protein